MKDMKTRKYLILILILLISAVISEAQIPRGTIVTGGSFSFEYKNEIVDDTKYKDLRFNIQPVLGYFLFNNFLLELDPEYGYHLFKYPIDYGGVEYLNDKEHSFGFSPKITYYFCKNNIHPFIQMGSFIYWVRGKSESYYTSVITSNYSSNNIYIQPAAGLLYSINNSIAIDLTLKYNWHNRKYKDGRFDSKGTVKYRGLVFYFGFKIFLSAK